MTKKQIPTSLRIPEYYYNSLVNQAKKENRSLNYLVNEAIVLFVKNLEKNEKAN
jgi:predicted HicB family RNase H-like nuclease